MKHLVALCVGHSRSGDDGAVSVSGESEWQFNDGLADMVALELEKLGIPSFKENAYQGSGYGAAMRWVAADVEIRHASLAVELHFNAANGAARGHEWLYWHSSKKSAHLANCLSSEFAEEFPEIPVRKPKAKSSGDRGAEFLRLTHCPAVICEPGFGDNPEDWRIMTDRKPDMARAIAAGIHKYLTV